MTFFDDIPYPLGIVDHTESPLALDDVVPKDDPSWPRRCDHCDQPFAEGDVYQVFARRLYRDPRSGLLTYWEAAEAGAMIDAWWYPFKGPDGLVLMVKLPNLADWVIDGLTTGGWTRAGVPPRISVQPSVAMNDWHGYLVDGVLVQA